MAWRGRLGADGHGVVGLGEAWRGRHGERREVAMRRTMRTTISVPMQLRERMDSVGRELNWSAIAAEAFEAALRRREEDHQINKRGNSWLYQEIVNPR